MKIGNARATLFASTAVALMMGSALAAPIVTNGGFETGSFGPWVSGGSGNNSISSSNPRTGTFAFHAGCVGAGCVVVAPTGVGGPGSITQTVNLQPGIYQFQFFATNPAGANQLAASVGNNTVINQSLGVIPYTNFSFITAASGGLTNLAIGVRQDPSFMDVDDVSLVMVDDGAGNNIAAASQTVAAQASRDMLDRIQDRFGHAGSPITTASAGDTVVASNDGGVYSHSNGKYRAYLSVFGDQGRWDSGDTRSNRGGLSVGFEFAPCDTIDLGIALSAGNSRYRTGSIFTVNHGKADEYLGALYAHWSPKSMPLYVTGAVGYGSSSNDFTRGSLAGLGEVGAQNVDTTQWFASVEAGFDWKFTNSIMVTPFARLDGARLSQDGYTEVPFAGALLVPAVVASQDQDAARSILGARVTTDFDLGSRSIKLTGKAGWAHEFERDRFVTFSETTGPVTFVGSASAAVPDQDTAVAGASVEMPVTENASFYAGYNGNYGSHQDIHAGEVGLRVNF